jgi:hypothetical protein
MDGLAPQEMGGIAAAAPSSFQHHWFWPGSVGCHRRCRESIVLQQLFADAGQDVIALLSWRRRNSLGVNTVLTTPNVRVLRKICR